jgi:hypothetical protein
LRANLNASNISLYDVDSLSRVPSISTAVLNVVISLSKIGFLSINSFYIYIGPFTDWLYWTIDENTIVISDEDEG